jgi:hypothetical protein
MREPHFEVWRQRHEELLQEAERARLAQELRAARRRSSPRPGCRPRGLAGWTAEKILAALRIPGGKARC